MFLDIFIDKSLKHMKKILVIVFLAIVSLAISYCTASKKAAKAPVKMTFNANVQTAVQTYCTPCHIPSKGGNKGALDNYADMSKHIDDVLRRIQLNPTDRGFMPFKKPKLSDSAINVFKQWKADGMLEK
jgi:hypothetical protein